MLKPMPFGQYMFETRYFECICNNIDILSEVVHHSCYQNQSTSSNIQTCPRYSDLIFCTLTLTFDGPI